MLITTAERLPITLFSDIVTWLIQNSLHPNATLQIACSVSMVLLMYSVLHVDIQPVP